MASPSGGVTCFALCLLVLLCEVQGIANTGGTGAVLQTAKVPRKVARLKGKGKVQIAEIAQVVSKPGSAAAVSASSQADVSSDDGEKETFLQAGKAVPLVKKAVVKGKEVAVKVNSAVPKVSSAVAQADAEDEENFAKAGNALPQVNSACNRTKDAEMRAYFKDVVLIVHINYAWVAHSTAAFWRNVYGRLFKQIVIVSEEDIPSLGVEARAPERNLKDWRICYANLPKIMARFPDAAGFMWTNDDVIINYWNLLGADKTKLWMPNDARKSPNDIRWFHRDHVAGPWDKQDWAAATRWKKVMRKAMDRMDKEYRRRFDRNIRPHKKEYPKRITDLFYIPRRLVEEFSFNVFPSFVTAGAPSELALPSMFYALDNPKNWDPVLDSTVFRWDQWEAKIQHKRCTFKPQEAWNASVVAFHPWKVGRDKAKVQLLEALMKADPCIGSSAGSL